MQRPCAKSVTKAILRGGFSFGADGPLSANEDYLVINLIRLGLMPSSQINALLQARLKLYEISPKG